jgi:hypothetical protein
LPGKHRHNAERYTSSRKTPACPNQLTSLLPAGPVNGKRVVTSVDPGAWPTRRILLSFDTSTTGALSPEGKQREQALTRSRCSSSSSIIAMIMPLPDETCP